MRKSKNFSKRTTKPNKNAIKALSVATIAGLAMIGAASPACAEVDNRIIIDTIDQTVTGDYSNRINNNERVIEEEYRNTEKDDIEEFMFMNLRMINGINENEFKCQIIDNKTTVECNINNCQVELMFNCSKPITLTAIEVK